MKVISIQILDDATQEALIVTETKPHWFLKLFGAKPTRMSYVGSGTIWHTYSDFNRVSNYLDQRLYNAWRRHKWMKLYGPKVTGP